MRNENDLIKLQGEKIRSRSQHLNPWKLVNLKSRRPNQRPTPGIYVSLHKWNPSNLSPTTYECRFEPLSREG
jgi:hypothetical protein